MTAAESRTRVVIQHFALPAYRLPVFAALAATPGLDVRLFFGRADGLENTPDGGFDAESSKVLRLNTPRGHLLWDRSQWESARKGRCDVLVMSWNTRSLSLLPTLWRARRNGIATLLWGHGYSRRDSRLRRWLRLIAADRADGVIFYSERTAERYVESTGRREGTFVARNAIDQAPIAAATERWQAGDRLARFRSDNDLGGGPVMLFVSRHKPANRVDLLVEACSMLRADHPGLKLVLVGPGLAEAAEVTAAVAAADMADHVRFTGPLYDEDAIAPWFLSADVFAYPSNLGLSVLHAFGYGLPVVTGDDEAASPPEWAAVEDGVNGLLCGAGSAHALAEGLRRVIEEPGLQASLSRGARATATSSYTLDRMVDGLRSAIAYAADRSAGAG